MIAGDPCPQCGANRNVVGRAHNCAPKSSDRGLSQPPGSGSSVPQIVAETKQRGNSGKPVRVQRDLVKAGSQNDQRDTVRSPKRGRPRIGEPHVKHEPWLALNMSRATYYRRQAEKREAKP